MLDPQQYGNAFLAEQVSTRVDAGEREGYGITGQSAEEDWSKLREEVAAFEATGSQELIDKTSDEDALLAGDILSATAKRDDGMIEERTSGLVNVPFEQFIQRVLPTEWSTKLAGRVGGDVDPLVADEQGRTVFQQDRMVLETPMSRHLSFLGDLMPVFKHLDMTKSEEIDYGNDSIRVRWRVYLSDNATVLQDIGYVDFARAGQATQVTFHSAHAFTEEYTAPMNSAPLSGVRDWMMGKQLQDAFTAHIAAYREEAGA